jgi:hypothetical protein
MPKMNIKPWALALAVVLSFVDNSFATNSYCAVAEKTSDGFVIVREGPGTQFKSLGRISKHDLLWIATEFCRSDFGASQCDETQTWVFVERVFSLEPAYSKLKGWVRSSLTHQIARKER